MRRRYEVGAVVRGGISYDFPMIHVHHFHFFPSRALYLSQYFSVR